MAKKDSGNKKYKKNFYYRHPKFRKFLDEIVFFLDNFIIWYWVGVIALLAIILIVLYYTLPNEIKIEVSSIVGGTLSIIIVPLGLNYINKRNENRMKLFEENKDLYLKLSNILISLITSYDITNKKNLHNFLCENYSIMCVTFSSSLIVDIISVNEEDDFENIKYYALKIIKKLRKESGINKTFYINRFAINWIDYYNKSK